MTDIPLETPCNGKTGRGPVVFALILLWRAICYSIRSRCIGPYFAIYKACLSLRSVWALAASGWTLAIVGWALLICGFVWQWWRMS